MAEQTGWRWCRKCEALYFYQSAEGGCPAGGYHAWQGSGHYILTFGSDRSNSESGWKWCRFCQCLFHERSDVLRLPPGGARAQTPVPRAFGRVLERHLCSRVPLGGTLGCRACRPVADHGHSTLGGPDPRSPDTLPAGVSGSRQWQRAARRIWQRGVYRRYRRSDGPVPKRLAALPQVPVPVLRGGRPAVGRLRPGSRPARGFRLHLLGQFRKACQTAVPVHRAGRPGRRLQDRYRKDRLGDFVSV